MSEWSSSIRKISFGGCGFRGAYYLGVIQALRYACPELIHQIEVFAGCSAGAIFVGILLLGISIEVALNSIKQLVSLIKFKYNRYAHRLLYSLIHV